MIQAEIIIVGGGPAGASAAMELIKGGKEVVILDKEKFPRTKLCAGWITPKVFSLLDKSPDEYPYGILKFDKLHYDFGKIKIPIKTTQFSIRRYEFDFWLHEISGVTVINHKVQKIEKKEGYFFIDDKFKCRYLIGAGGTYCPVYKTFFDKINPRDRENKIVAVEEEFEYDWHDQRCLLWFGDLKLRGYSWYVPKSDGFLNVGIGGTFYGVRREGKNIKKHWENFITKLEHTGLVKNRVFNGKGYSYYLRTGKKIVSRDNAFIIGDAVGLATIDMGEGIAPAIESGILAAREILYGEKYSPDKIGRFSFPSIVFSRKY